VKTIHGLTKREYDENGKRINHPLFNTWRAMIARCYDVNNISYHNYGGRGINTCPEWREPKLFSEWAFANGWEKGLHLDRIDNNGDYYPQNCRFITQSENNKNQRAIRKDNKTGYRGICYDSRVKTPWYASIQYNKKRIHIRSFSTAKEAAIARDNYIKEHNLNLPLNDIKGERS
jgi:hypothetical protein